MNRSMRRKDRLMNQEAAIELLMRGEYGVLSSVDEEGQPYGVPVNYVFDGLETIYFHCAKEGHKLDNLKTNPKVCFTVVGDTQVMDWKFTTAFESVIVFGIAHEVEGEEKYQGLRMLALKYSPDYEEEFNKDIDKAMIPTQVMKIQVKQLTGKELKVDNKE
ncbi:MAG: pyridoxamine 5'-phosphate oxidase family protein [Anaerolineaceae bacterium]|nr:pyridoxamine 5'-phosphate oxidase family protein [Anaerolineaceae bacterium]